MKKPLILIAGPTASGKTGSSVALAKRINGEIISADSMQIYKGMDIGTAKVRKEEMDGIPHYMIDEVEPRDGCNVSLFKNKVKAYIDEIHAKGKVPILVGGTGFYINAILYDTNFEEGEEDTSYRKELQSIVDTYGAKYLHEQLLAVDPESAEAIHFNNVKRVIRALEYYKQTGTPISLHNATEKDKRIVDESPYDYHFFVLTMDRATLYERINFRVDQMMEQGLLEEVRTFWDSGFTEDMPAMKAIGYKEFFPYFRQDAALDECVDKLKQNTRQYAKRQLTWFKHQTSPVMIDVDLCDFKVENIVSNMLGYIKNF